MKKWIERLFSILFVIALVTYWITGDSALAAKVFTVPVFAILTPIMTLKVTGKINRIQRLWECLF